MQQRFCEYCGKPLNSIQKRFCSKSCNASWHNIRRKKKEATYNTCLSCGKEIPSWKKFCNRSCAATYNNSHRERKSWTEEQRRVFSEKQKEKQSLSKESKKQQKNENICICKYCQRPFNSIIHTHICEECRPFIQNIKAFNRLGILEGPLKERFERALKELKDFYFVQNKGLLQTSKLTGLNQTTIRGLFQKAGIKLRSISEGARIAIQEGRIKQEGDPVGFASGIHISWEGKPFHYRSSWEEKYMQELDKKKIPYEYEFRWIWYEDSKTGEKRLAHPDFYFPDTNEIVELKSDYTLRGKVQEMKDKFKAYQKEGYRPKLILNWKEVVLDDNFTENSF